MLQTLKRSGNGIGNQPVFALMFFTVCMGYSENSEWTT
jgi:hypothetical protein